MPKLKVCFTSNSSPWSKFSGGGQIFIHNIAKNLCNLGHHVTVIYTGKDNRTGSERIKQNYNINWVPYLGYPWTAKLRQLNSITVYSRLKRLHSKYKFDVINSLGGESLFIPRLCKVNNIPFFVSIEHPNLPAVNPTTNWKKPFQSCVNIAQARELKICKYACNNATAVFSPSAFTKKEAIEHFGLEPEKINIVYHGIIDEMLSGIKDNGHRNINGPLIFFGRLEPQKGVETLINAYYNLLNRKIVTNQNLIIIGSGPYEKKYKKLTKVLGLKNRIHFTGWKSSDYIKIQLAKGSFCILPSITESFGLSMAEAISVGVPLITTSAGSIPEVVDYGKGAWLAKPNDIESLTNVVDKAMKNISESIRKAEYGKKVVLQKFSWAEAAKKYEQIYFNCTSKMNDLKEFAK